MMLSHQSVCGAGTQSFSLQEVHRHHHHHRRRFWRLGNYLTLFLSISIDRKCSLQFVIMMMMMAMMMMRTIIYFDRFSLGHSILISNCLHCLLTLAGRTSTARALIPPNPNQLRRARARPHGSFLSLQVVFGSLIKSSPDLSNLIRFQ